MNSVSKQYGTQDGLAFCGDYQYSLLDEETHASILQLDSATNEIAFSTQSDVEIGLWYVDVVLRLVDYASVESTQTLTLTINPCQETQITI